ncbi:hypothetical protein P5W98_03365 [Paraburkholderia sp. A1BS-2L]|uniref:hypothetical protein n=1 Tax=Paraburkholderia sp. A1BS-2L TaxID=3028373 RepID=UPI003DA84DFA
MQATRAQSFDSATFSLSLATQRQDGKISRKHGVFCLLSFADLNRPSEDSNEVVPAFGGALGSQPEAGFE